ncbi:hypothetical protein GCM10027020_04530 [Nocardioides salsibiostraticola]
MPRLTALRAARPAGKFRLLSGAVAATLVLGSLSLTAPTVESPVLSDSVTVTSPSVKRPGGAVPRDWAPLFMSANHSYSRAEAVTLAKKYDLIVAIPSGIRKHTAAMRAANGNLNILAYSNAVLASSSQIKGLPETAFSHDTSGGRVIAPGFGTYMMNPANVQWRVRANQLCRDRVNSGKFDGCLVDVLTLGIFAKNFVSSVPVNPNTGRKFTEGEYRGEVIALARDLRERSGDLVQIGNMVENSYRYWKADVTSRPIVSSAPGAQMEDFLRGSFNASDKFPSLGTWRDEVRVITDMESQGKTGLFTTKLWSGASQARIKQWHGYAMATFLMGANGNSFFAFTSSRDRAGASGMNHRYRLPNLGTAYGAMYRQSAGAYVRSYANGMAAVNPTQRAVRVQIKGVMRRLDGSVVSGSFTLPARSGEALREAGNVPLKLKVAKVKRQLTLRAGKTRHIPVRVTNVGGQAAPKGVVKLSGTAIKSSAKGVRKLRPGQSVKMRVLVRARSARSARSKVRFHYRAGGKRDIGSMKVKVVRR